MVMLLREVDGTVDGVIITKTTTLEEVQKIIHHYNEEEDEYDITAMIFPKDVEVEMFPKAVYY